MPKKTRPRRVDITQSNSWDEYVRSVINEDQNKFESTKKGSLKDEDDLQFGELDSLEIRKETKNLANHNYVHRQKLSEEYRAWSTVYILIGFCGFVFIRLNFDLPRIYLWLWMGVWVFKSLRLALISGFILGDEAYGNMKVRSRKRSYPLTSNLPIWIIPIVFIVSFLIGLLISK